MRQIRFLKAHRNNARQDIRRHGLLIEAAVRGGAGLALLVCLGGLGGGCRTAEKTMLCVSRLKSPVTLAVPALNQPFTPAELGQAEIDPSTLRPREPAAAAPAGAKMSAARTGHSVPRFDRCGDLRQKDTVVMVAVSGGGARAARMAAHTLAAVEHRYNEVCQPGAGERPLAGRIDAWSGISGGSVYASFVAMQLLRDQGSRSNTFARLVSDGRARWGTQRLGGIAALYYLWPGNIGYGPVMQFLTDWDTLDLFAHTLALCHEGGLPMLPVPRMTRLGDLPAAPRFFFNATCRETLRPLIFTQSVVHRDLSGDPFARLARDPLLLWTEGEPVAAGELDEPFRYASTLEDLGSPPNRFPLAYAAMASAAFPGIFEPLPLARYWLCTNSSPGSLKAANLCWLRSETTLADGGLYDNTGLVTALQFFEYLRHATARPKKLILLAIDANNEAEGYTGARRPSRFPIHYGLPLRGAAAGLATAGKVYSRQQALVTAALNHRIKALEKEGSLEFYAIRLKDAARLIPSTEDISVKAKLRRWQHEAATQPWTHLQALSFFGIVEDIPTDFVLSNQEDKDLKSIVEKLLDWKEPANSASVADRFVQAVAGGAPTAAEPAAASGR